MYLYGIYGSHYQTCFKTKNNCCGGAVGYSVRLASGRLGVRIPAAIEIDLSRKKR